MKYLIAILIVLLVLIFFPQILGGIIGVTLVFALFPTMKIVIGVITIWVTFAFLLNKRKNKRNVNENFTSYQIKK